MGDISGDNIISALTILTLAGAAFTVYFSMKRVSDNIRVDAQWKTTVELKITMLIEKIDTLIESKKNMDVIVRDLADSRSRYDERFKSVFTELDYLRDKMSKHMNGHMTGKRHDDKTDDKN